MEGTGPAARILVADDDPVIRRLIEVNLGLEGFEVELAADGEDAVARAGASSPDLIVLDVMMPGLTGWEAAQRLKEDPATQHIPVVLLSARTREEDVRRGRDVGAAAYVTKPFDPPELVNVVRKLTTATGR
ncbi:MAG: response regulator transcription factor [Actinomycetota bacterium]